MMGRAVTSPILRLIRQVVEDPRVRDASDYDLLQRFSGHRDEAAFHALLRRHGPMVFDVCRGVLGNEANAEDAFQATFLVLARKAASIHKAASLGSWLHSVAYRTALRARAQEARRMESQAHAPARQVSEADDLTWREVRAVLHEELNRLPERYRVALVMCYLESKTQDQAARQLGLAKSTLKERLERGRKLLKSRLVRRGLGPPAVLVVAAWPAPVARACLRATLISATVRAAGQSVAGQATGGVISAKVAALSEGVMRAMLVTKLKIATVLVVTVIGGIGTAALLASGGGVGSQGKGRTADTRPDLSNARFQTEAISAKEGLAGKWTLIETYKQGKKVAVQEIPIKQHTLAIAADNVVMHLADGGSEKGTLELDPTKKPKEMTITWLVQWRAIYRVEKERLTLCFNPDNGIRPDELRTSADSGRVLLVYEQDDAKKRDAAKELADINKAIHAMMRAVNKEAAAQAAVFAYPGAKRLDERAGNVGVTLAGSVYQSLYTTPDELSKVAKWYDKKVAGLTADQPGAVTGEPDGTRRAVYQDGEQLGLEALAKRPVSTRTFLVRTKPHTLSVVLCRPPGETLTVILLTYLPE